MKRLLMIILAIVVVFSALTSIACNEPAQPVVIGDEIED